MGELSVVNSSNIYGLIQRTLNHVDSRLVNHGSRVAYLVRYMLEAHGGFTGKEKQEIGFLALLHDIGAYKTEEINEMERFEAENIWRHSIYGYLFLHHFSPLRDWAEAVLYHHVSAESLEGVEEKIALVSQIMNLADRVDMFWLKIRDKGMLEAYLNKSRGSRFRPDVVDLFFQADRDFSMMDAWNGEEKQQTEMPEAVMSVEECEEYLRMLIFSIDFRSQHTVTHTITTTCISCSIARLMGMGEEQIHDIYYGALLHDLGKIGIPVEILEFPGKLSPQAMKIMRTHVGITEEILGGKIHPAITRIAVRHHEKLDGSGYPRGIGRDVLTLEEQVVAVSDMVSALLGTRSYKKAYSSDKTLSILQEQAEGGKISQEIVNIVSGHFEEIISDISEKNTPILSTYNGLNEEYGVLLRQCQCL